MTSVLKVVRTNRLLIINMSRKNTSVQLHMQRTCVVSATHLHGVVGSNFDEVLDELSSMLEVDVGWEERNTTCQQDSV